MDEDGIEDGVLHCMYCGRQAGLPVIFALFICETCMNTYSDTGVWPEILA